MTLNEQLIFLIDKKIDILGMGMLFGLLGIVVYFITPTKYDAVGSLFIARSVEDNEPLESLVQDPSIENTNDTTVPEQNTNAPSSEGVFTYEGYYAQQNAVTYTTSLVGIIESDVLRGALLRDLGYPVTGKNLRNLGRIIHTKRQAPQLIEISIEASSANIAQENWLRMTDLLINISNSLNLQSDPNLKIIKVTSKPVVSESFKSMPLNFVLGFGFGILISSLALAFQEYMGTSNDISLRTNRKSTRAASKKNQNASN